ncbi:MAG: hypothetical protein K8T90_19855 [Planctomycetes bacterium]|nr:hypothetical protein [Planctomycetota bacterium]
MPFTLRSLTAAASLLLAVLLGASCAPPDPPSDNADVANAPDATRVQSGHSTRPYPIQFVEGLSLTPDAELAGSLLVGSADRAFDADDADVPSVLLAWAILAREPTGALDVGRAIEAGAPHGSFTTRAIGVLLLRGADDHDAALTALLGEPTPTVTAERWTGADAPERADLAGLSVGGALAVDVLDALESAVETDDGASIEERAVRVLLAEPLGDAAFRFLAVQGRTARARVAGLVGLGVTSPAELDVALAAIRSAALVPAAPGDADLDVRLTPGGRLAARVLADAGTFPGVCTGEDGAPTRDAFAMKVLLADPLAAEAFADLALNGNATGRMFAACGLYLRDRAALAASRDSLLEIQVVRCQDGCCIESRPAATVLAEIESGAFPALFELSGK